ncbi:MAG: hypothetical protein J7M25_06725 [Deltaproteobacteria bacterium]|nr:hypothetical protein [Deltaproteobacteria bacterium]
MSDSTKTSTLLTSWLSARLGLLVLVLAAVGVGLFMRRGGHRSRAGGPAAAKMTKAALPTTVDAAKAYCKQRGWPVGPTPARTDGSLMPASLAGAFPALGALPRVAHGLQRFKDELKAGGMGRQRKAALMERLAVGYAIRARYFLAIVMHPERQSAGRRTARRASDRRRSGRRGAAGRGAARRRRRGGTRRQGHRAAGMTSPAMRHGGHRGRAHRSRTMFERRYSRAEALRRYRRYLRMSLFFYRELVTHRFKGIETDRILYEFASLLVLAGAKGQAVEQLARIVDEFSDSHYATMARLYLAIEHQERGQCAKVGADLKDIKLDGMGLLGMTAALARSRCFLAGHDYGRALAWLERAYREGHKLDASQVAEEERPVLGRAMMAVRLDLAEAFRRAASPAGALAFAKVLGPGRSSLLLVGLVTAYFKAKMSREAGIICRDASDSVGKHWAEAKKLDARDRRMATSFHRRIAAVTVRRRLRIRGPDGGQGPGGTLGVGRRRLGPGVPGVRGRSVGRSGVGSGSAGQGNRGVRDLRSAAGRRRVRVGMRVPSGATRRRAGQRRPVGHARRTLGQVRSGRGRRTRHASPRRGARPQ